MTGLFVPCQPLNDVEKTTLYDFHMQYMVLTLTGVAETSLLLCL